MTASARESMSAELVQLRRRWTMVDRLVDALRGATGTDALRGATGTHE